MDERNEFSERLKQLRGEYGYSAKEFAYMLNIKLQTYYAYESGTLPSYKALVRIAEKCGVSLDWLCGITPIRKSTTSKKDVMKILKELLSTNESGQQIMVQISRGEIAERRKPLNQEGYDSFEGGK